MCKSIRVKGYSIATIDASMHKAINQRWKFNKNTKNIQKHKRSSCLHTRNAQLDKNVCSMKLSCEQHAQRKEKGYLKNILYPAKI